ncbi:MAG TPA: hypothetical protein VH142_00135 [Polyangiaceae bacterium]|jgi:hypothetical protein|nr:hypothetical protein [Polyangiaceae bacterium]
MRAFRALVSILPLIALAPAARAAGADSAGPPGGDSTAPSSDAATSPPDVPAAPSDETATPATPAGQAGEAHPEPAGPEIPTPTLRAPSAHGQPGDAEADQAAAEVRSARDTLGRHFALGAMAGLFVPFGSFQSGASQSTLLDPGLVIGVDAGYGISRTVVLGAYGDFALPQATDACRDCKVTSIAVGPMIRYHLVQGLRFDPWLSAGAGFRRTSTKTETFTGIDIARFELGGDWYPAPSFGFGPFMELGFGEYTGSNTTIQTHALNAEFSLGLRVVFDAPGR